MMGEGVVEAVRGNTRLVESARVKRTCGAVGVVVMRFAAQGLEATCEMPGGKTG